MTSMVPILPLLLAIMVILVFVPILIRERILIIVRISISLFIRLRDINGGERNANIDANVDTALILYLLSFL